MDDLKPLAPPPETDRRFSSGVSYPAGRGSEPFTSRDRTAPPQQINATASLPAATVRQQPPPAVFPTTTASPANSLPELFIGNIPLHPHSAFKVNGDKIADAFHNSSRKTSTSFHLRYKTEKSLFVLQSTQFVRDPSAGTLPLLDIFWEKSHTSTTLMNLCVLFGRVCVMLKQRRMDFSFSNLKLSAMEEVIEGGPWLYLGQPIVLQKWEPGMVLRKLKHTEVPVWIKLRHLPVELWTTEGLSTVASGIGRPLYPDAITRACTRLDFARVCVMLNVDVEYEWLPPKCKQCVSLGHSTATCPESNKIEKPKVAVYVQKRQVQPPPTVSKTMAKECPYSSARILNVRGLNRRDHQAAVKELVNEFRLNFLGLLETRVSAVNVLRIQTFLPRWSWFTDYDMPVSVDGGCGSLVTLADSISDEPWIVGGDFNTVVDMSEVCGASADIHLAMNEFRDLKEIVAYGNVWIDCWLMMLGYDCGQIRIINVLTLELPITPHLCSEEILIIIWKKKGDLSVNVKLAAEFLATNCAIGLTDIILYCSALRSAAKATKLEQVMLQQRAKIQWLKGGDQCSRIFFRKRLLGGDRRRDFIDLRYLRPWARHVLTQEESQALVQSVTREEIKDAFFDIAEDKAPGPDGYSSGFYKAAGRLLVNTTILALIPKRLRLVLDKLISPSQNAFVPGRSIGDNILLAQELFAGYNRQGLPMRCALKVDLRKAYDTVEWDFLSAVLQMFGFPAPLLDGLKSVSLLLCSRFASMGTLTVSSRVPGG
ncbi:UNVERIFIED_CONTAM: hypothetical protein Sangu_3195000 [Sesamum angustifolium]|uniref:Reverse transcriptase domain-containing protein n=1 Tax=Sesamum angustifolium TaxID=2727405 RepID=A0AAW2JNB1_9LAMI